MDSLKVSLAQLNVHLGDPELNVSQAMKWVEQAAQDGSQLILFPELWSSGYDLDHISDYAQVLGSGLWDQLASKASECSIAIGGTIIEKLADQYFNTSVLFDAYGSALGFYRKIHLFRTIGEDHYLSSGDRLTLLETPWGKTGLATCYDLRFPEIFRIYALNGAKIILLPAEWPSRRLEHWQTLLRARAIENQLFIIAVNAVGTYDDETYAGHSAVISPWGEIIIEAGTEAVLLTCQINLAEIEQVRKRITVFEDRRPEAYRLL